MVLLFVTTWLASAIYFLRHHLVKYLLVLFDAVDLLVHLKLLQYLLKRVRLTASSGNVGLNHPNLGELFSQKLKELNWFVCSIGVGLISHHSDVCYGL